jgi:hypothetical protein
MINFIDQSANNRHRLRTFYHVQLGIVPAAVLKISGGIPTTMVYEHRPHSK